MDQPVVYIVDDDESVRTALARLLSFNGIISVELQSASELLEAEPLRRPSCIILDVNLPGLSGLDLQAELASRNLHSPIIFISGSGDIPMTLHAMRAGAIDFLPKPFDDDTILFAIKRGIDKDREQFTD